MDWTHRAIILKACAIGVIIFSLLVLIWANLVPDLGMETFGSKSAEGKRVERLVRLRRPPVTQPAPLPGDVILRIGGETVDSLPRQVNIVANLRDPIRFPAPTVASLDELTDQSAPCVQHGDDKLIRVDFVSQQGKPFSAWCQVSDQPIRNSLISIVWFAIESMLFWLGWQVFRHRPHDNTAAVFFLMCIVTVGAYMGGYHWLQIASYPLLTFIFAICAMAVPQVSLHFYLLFPEPKRLILRYPRLTWILLYLIPSLIQLAVLWQIGMVVYAFRHHLPIETLERQMHWLWVLVLTYMQFGAFAFLGCVISLMHSYGVVRRENQRLQVRWLLVCSIVASVFVTYSLWMARFNPQLFVLGGATWSMFAASFVLTVAYGVSILRFQLMDDEQHLRRGMQYFLISFSAGMAYYGFIMLAILLGFPLLGQGQALLNALFVIIVMLLLGSVRTRVQQVLDRRFYREKHQVDHSLKRMHEAVGQLVDQRTVLDRALMVVREQFEARDIAVYLRGADGNFPQISQPFCRRFPQRFEPNDALVQWLSKGVLLQNKPGAMISDQVSMLLRRMSAELAQPLLLDGALTGFMLVGARMEGMYSSEELGFLTGLAELISLALQSSDQQQTLATINTQLQQQVERMSEQQRQLLALQTDAIPHRLAPAPTEARPVNADQLLGSSPAMAALLQTVQKVSSSGATVLLRGESGVGKSMLAEIIHQNSTRRDGPFVSVHCAALSPTLLESELFGHVKGAFTGADRDKVGRFQLADTGTLFLDEIGDLAPDLQVKLLRVIQEMTIEPVGSSTPIRVNVRLIAATHQPLEDLVERGVMRQDLFYRLNVISLFVPGLRQRKEDIPALALQFVRQFAKEMNKPIEGTSEEAMQTLLRYDWPGNVRELENVMERAVVLAEGKLVRSEDLPSDLHRPVPRSPAILPSGAGRLPLSAGSASTRAKPDSGTLIGEIKLLERQRLIDALHQSNGKKAEAARLLGIPRTTLISKMKKFGIE